MIALDPINWRTQLAKDDTEYRWSGAFAERPTLNRAFRPGTVHDFSQAHLAGGLKLSGAANVEVHGGTFIGPDNPTIAPDKESAKAIFVIACSAVRIVGAMLQGSGNAVEVNGCAGLHIEDVETSPSSFANGLMLSGVADGEVRGCRIFSPLADSVHVGGCQRLRIIGNDLIGRWEGFSVHPDAIQLQGWSEWVWILGNRINRTGQGDFGSANNTGETPATNVFVFGNDIAVSYARALSAPDGAVNWFEGGNRITTLPGSGEQARIWGPWTRLGGTTVAAYTNAAQRSWRAS